MSLTEASDTEKMQVKITIDKQSKNGDEQIEGKGVSDTPEFEDPAILLLRRDVAKIRYTKDELLKFRDAPFSRKKPDFFDEVSPAILDPERWNFDKKKSESQSSESGGGPRLGPEGGAPAADQPNSRRRVGDPRERVRKENDGIVLSPQRRSFNSGCFVPIRVDAVARSNRSHSPLGPKNDGPHMGMREMQSSSRRIGSGRIMRDSWDFNNDKPDSSSGSVGGDNEYSFRGGPPQRNNNERDDKFGGGGGDKYERRSFGREFDMGGRGDRENNNKEPPPSSRRNGRFDRRRVNDHREQEEPEWFSGGPISQNDTIELRGFEESDKPGKKKLSPSRVKRAKEWSKKKTETQQQNTSDDKVESKESVGRSTPTPQTAAESGEQPEKKVEKDTKEEPAKEAAKKTSEENKVGALANDQAFNFDDILKCDSIPGLLTNGICNDGDTNTKSRFSRWFKQESPEKVESRRSSLHDDHHIKDLLKDISETSVSIPGDSEAYFAPISPAANTGGIIGGKRSAHAQQQHSQPINIMEMLQRGKQQHQHVDAAKQQGMAGKILSLDELEAKMRQNVPDRPTGLAQKHQQQKPDEEMAAAFKKLLAQAQAGGHPATSNGPISKAQPMSLLEMLNHSQQQDEAARLVGPSSHLLGPASPNVSHHHHGANDLSLKLQQAQLQQQKQQMDMLNKLINATTTSVHASQMRTSPLHDMGMQQSRDLLNRPEAQAILHGLKRGEITTQHLYQQLSNPALQPRHREMLMTILKMQSTGYGPSPRVLSPVPPHHMFQQQQQQQQLRVSPLPPNAMHQRIPSPRELQVHTQNILQRALIKKKLEEQQENYRKKQEMQRGQSPNTGGGAQGPSKSVSSPTPLAFTPTSVLRKMTADKDDGKENKSSIDGKIPPGRPLTGVRPQPVQPQGQQWNQSYASVKHPGRPIVKANNYQTQTAEQFFSQHQQQQQQQRMFNQPPPGVSGQRKSGNVAVGSQFGPSQGVAQSQYNSQQYSTNQQFTQQQLRAQHQHRPVNQQQQPAVIQQQQQQRGQQQLGFQQQQGGQAAGPAWQQFFSSAQGTRSGNPAGRSGPNDGSCSGDLSPTTTNQLARWFSPDLLERARGGELPSTAGLAQHALSLEELERQTAPPAVHN